MHGPKGDVGHLGLHFHNFLQAQTPWEGSEVHTVVGISTAGIRAPQNKLCLIRAGAWCPRNITVQTFIQGFKKPFVTDKANGISAAMAQPWQTTAPQSNLSESLFGFSMPPWDGIPRLCSHKLEPTISSFPRPQFAPLTSPGSFWHEGCSLFLL